jgi:hypothetical protein
MNRRILIGGLLAAASLGLGGQVRAAAEAPMLQDGATVPAVPVLQSIAGGNAEPFDLKAASTGKTLVLYFFPKAFTED